MINAIFSAIIFTLCITFTFGGVKMSTVNRSFLRMHKGLFEASVVTEVQEGKLIAYFDEPTLESYLVAYLKQNVESHVSDYETSLYYFDRDTESVCTNHRCNGVKIMLSADINSFYQYKKARVFTINERGGINE